MSALLIGFALWFDSLTRTQLPPPPPPTAGVPRGEKPRNVRPWVAPVTTPATVPSNPPPGECVPEKEKK